MSKAREKRYVLRVDLNKDNEEACLMGRGKSFHNLGAATANARSLWAYALFLAHSGTADQLTWENGWACKGVAAQKCKVGQAHLGI